MSIQSVNMWRSLGALPHGPVRIQREIEEDPLGAHPESNEEGGLVPAKQFRRKTFRREPTDQRLPERIRPNAVRLALLGEHVRRTDAPVPTVFEELHESELGELGRDLANRLPCQPDSSRKILKRDSRGLERRRKNGGASRGREGGEERRVLRESRSEEHTSELQSRQYLVCRLLLEKKKNRRILMLYCGGG